MKSLPFVALAVLVAIAAILAGCGNSAPSPTPTAAAVVVAPTATFMPTATTRPTSTPSPQPTSTPVPTAAPASGDVAALLKEVQSKQMDVKSARGLMEITVEGKQDGLPQSAFISADFEMNEPDVSMVMKMKSPELPVPMEIGFVVAGKTAYMKMGGEWMSFPADEEKSGSFGDMDMVNMEELQEFLRDATNVRLLGRRTVKGVECDVVGFTLSQAKMLELARKQGKLGEGDDFPEDLGFEAFSGEFALGVKDRLMHQMVIDMSMFDKSAPSDRFKMKMSYTLWDVNAPGIVIKPPAGAVPFGLPVSTPLPRS